MRLTLIGVGRLKAGPERELFARYFKRAADLGRAQGIAAVELREIDESRARRAEDRCAEEARAIRAAVPKGAWLTLLDERGAALTSRQWADEIGRARDGGVAAYALAIGGPDGLDPALKTEARALVSLRRHDLAAPARPGDGRRAALSRAFHPERPSLSSRLIQDRRRCSTGPERS